MESFRHIAPGLRLFHGDDCLSWLTGELDRVGSRRAAIVCGATVARRADLAGRVRELLGPRCVEVFDGVRAHSPVSAVESGASRLRSARADAVVALGGGSALVTARAAVILAAENRDARSVCSYLRDDGRFISPKLLAPKLPILVVPTTPTTAIVKAGSGVLEEPSGRRLTMFDPKTRAQAVFVHPAFAGSAPTSLALGAGLNALAMTVEALGSDAGNPLSDALLIHALRLLSRGLLLLTADAGAAESRDDLMLAAILCGQGTDQANPGVCAALGHSLGTRSAVANGLAQCILLPHTMRFNAVATGHRAGKVAMGLGRAAFPASPQADIQAVEELLGRLGIARRLRDAGVTREVFGEVARACLEDWFLRLNVRPVRTESELLEILHAAW
ncbi:MAG: iron-containing alcohol dehydrogenase family protein [Lautropia sp.]